MLWILAALAQNAALSVPVPDGYRDVSTKEAIVLVHGTPGADDAASINFVRGEYHPEDKLGDPKACAAFAEDMANHQHATFQTSSIVDGPAGKTCQIALYFKAQDATVASTILQGRKETWIMTCAMRAPNTSALRQCQKTLGSIKLK